MPRETRAQRDIRIAGEAGALLGKLVRDAGGLMPATVVYVLQEIARDGYIDEVIGVYSTRTLAEQAAKRTPDIQTQISAFEVDRRHPVDA